MEKADKGWLMVRIGVSRWIFLLVLAHLGSPGQRATKPLLLYRCMYIIIGACTYREFQAPGRQLPSTRWFRSYVTNTTPVICRTSNTLKSTECDLLIPIKPTSRS